MRRRHCWNGRLALATGGCAMLLLLGGAVHAQTRQYAEYTLELAGEPLTLLAESVDGRWEPVVWAHGRPTDRGNYFGRITGNASAAGQTELRLQLFGGDRPGASNPPREYTVAFAVTGEQLAGTWSEKTGGAARTGKLTGRVRTSALAAFTPPAPGEHPRLLCRRTDLPALRAKAQTPFGQQLLKQLAANDPLSLTRMAVGHGLLYALTGEKKHADKAIELLKADYSSGKWVRTEVQYPYVPVHDAGSTAVEAALAFDLIYDACDAPFRQAMLDLFAHRARYLYFAPANGADSSNWSAIYRSGAGMAALSALESASEQLPKPVAPTIRELKPAADLAAGELGADVPLVEFAGGEIKTWLTGGPLFRQIGQDLCEPLGKPPYRPRGGMTIESKAMVRVQNEIRPAPNDGKSTFRIHGNKGVPAPWPYDIKGLAGGTTRLLYFYSVLNVKAAGVFEVKCTTGRITDYRVLIADREVRDRDLVRLAPGRYPVLLAVEPGDNRRAHQIPYRFWLNPVSETETKTKLAALQAEHESERAVWQFWSGVAAEKGQANPQAAYWLGMARLLAGNYLRWDIGEFGFNMEGEAYTQHSLRALLPFAHGYRNATGKPLIGGPNVGLILPGYVARTIFRADGAAFLGYSTGGAPLGVDNYARGFALVPEPLQPAALWGWTRTRALAEAGKFKGPYQPVEFLDPMSAAFLFVNYPLDAKERNPAEVLPRVPVDRQLGGYVFRNRWQDGEDICATMFANLNSPGGSWAGFEAGDFRISGLGVDWAVRGRGNGVGGDQGNETGGDFNKPFLGYPLASWEAPPTFFKAGKDGSAILSLNMDQIYYGMPKAAGGKTVTGKSAMCTASPQAKDLGVKGRRSFAADYSGAAGVPGLFVVADQITGAPKPPVWQMVTDRSNTVTVAGNSFTLTAPNGATLRGTVIAPANAVIATRAVAHGHEAYYHVHHGAATFERTVIDVSGGDFFLVVLTLQKGQPPPVTVTGQWPAAKVRVGQQSIALDGDKITLGVLKE